MYVVGTVASYAIKCIASGIVYFTIGLCIKLPILIIFPDSTPHTMRYNVLTGVSRYITDGSIITGIGTAVLLLDWGVQSVSAVWR